MIGRSTIPSGRSLQPMQSDSCRSADALTSLSVTFSMSAFIDSWGVALKQKAQPELDSARDAKLVFEAEPQDATGEAFQEAQQKLQGVYTKLAGMYMAAKRGCNGLVLSP